MNPEISLSGIGPFTGLACPTYLTKMQREIGKEGGIVVEGRDTVSVVFPGAEVKFYLDADIDERARRSGGNYRRRSEEIGAGKKRDGKEG